MSDDDDELLPPGPYSHVTIEWHAEGIRTITVDEWEECPECDGAKGWFSDHTGE